MAQTDLCRVCRRDTENITPSQQWCARRLPGVVLCKNCAKAFKCFAELKIDEVPTETIFSFWLCKRITSHHPPWKVRVRENESAKMREQDPEKYRQHKLRRTARLAHSRQQRALNPEAAAAYAAHREATKERRLRWQREWYAKNRQARRDYAKERYAKKQQSRKDK